MGPIPRVIEWPVCISRPRNSRESPSSPSPLLAISGDATVSFFDHRAILDLLEKKVHGQTLANFRYHMFEGQRDRGSGSLFHYYLTSYGSSRDLYGMAVDPRDMDSLWVGRPFRGHMPMAVLPVHLAHALHDLRGIRSLSRVDQFLRLSILRDRLTDLHQLTYNAQFILANILMASRPGFLRAESSLVEGMFTLGDSYGRKIHGDIPRDMMPVLGPENSLEFVGLLSSSDMEKIRRYFQASPVRDIFLPIVSFLEGGGKRAQSRGDRTLPGGDGARGTSPVAP